MQKRIWGFFWTSRDFPSHRYQWKLERAEVPKRDTPESGRPLGNRVRYEKSPLRCEDRELFRCEASERSPPVGVARRLLELVIPPPSS